MFIKSMLTVINVEPESTSLQEQPTNCKRIAHILFGWEKNPFDHYHMEGFQPTSKVCRTKHVRHSDPEMGSNLQSNTICNLQSNTHVASRGGKKYGETHTPPGKIVLGLVARAFPGHPPPLYGRGLVGCKNRAPPSSRSSSISSYLLLRGHKNWGGGPGAWRPASWCQTGC